MATVRLTWADGNYGEEGHRIYRDTSPMSLGSLPTPLADIDADLTQYDDTTAVDDTTYYYRVSAYIGLDEEISDEITITPGGAALPAIADNNATYTADLSTVAAWSGDTGSISSDGSALTISGTAQQVSQAATDIKSGDWIRYLKVELQSGYVSWYNSTTGAETAFSLGYRWETGAVQDGWLSFGAKVSGAWKAVELAYDYKTAPIEVAIQYDSRVDAINLFIKESGEWDYKGSVSNPDNPYENDSLARIATGGLASAVDCITHHWLSAKPNIVAIGDSITAGHNYFDPDPGFYAGTDDYDFSFMKHAALYPSLINNLIVNYGVGGDSSADIDARVNLMLTATSPRVVLLNASSNDYGAGISLAQRTINIQSSVDKILAAGADAVLHNAVYPNSLSTNYPGNADLYRNWWNTELSNITGLSLAIDIMGDSGILDGDYMDAAYTEPDGVHPNSSGYSLIGSYIQSLQ